MRHTMVMVRVRVRVGQMVAPRKGSVHKGCCTPAHAHAQSASAVQCQRQRLHVLPHGAGVMALAHSSNMRWGCKGGPAAASATITRPIPALTQRHRLITLHTMSMHARPHAPRPALHSPHPTLGTPAAFPPLEPPPPLPPDPPAAPWP